MQDRAGYSAICVMVLSLISGCNTIRFSNLSPGTRYEVGDVFTSDEVDILVESFCWGDEWTSNGTARVDNRQISGGSGNDLNSCNVNLFFQFDYPRSKITMKFADCGGNENISINGDFLNIAALVDLDGQLLGGVTISVTAVEIGNQWKGKIELEGPINSFRIGGQELWIDNVHY